MRLSTLISALACTALAAALPVAVAPPSAAGQEKPPALWPQEGYASLRAAAAKAKAGGKRLLLGLSGGDH